MKKYRAEFYRKHERLRDQYVTMTFQARDLEAALVRVKKDLLRLQRLPNPFNHTAWMMCNLLEVSP